MDDQGFDNIARRLGGLRTRRDALKTAGCGTAAAVFAALGLEKSALAQQVGIENHCLVRGERCDSKLECCGARRRSKEIVCKASNVDGADRCCGQAKASCLDDDDCCLAYTCNTNFRCVRI
jgi:hypothetical protein